MVPSTLHDHWQKLVPEIMSKLDEGDHHSLSLSSLSPSSGARTGAEPSPHAAYGEEDEGEKGEKGEDVGESGSTKGSCSDHEDTEARRSLYSKEDGLPNDGEGKGAEEGSVVDDSEGNDSHDEDDRESGADIEERSSVDDDGSRANSSIGSADNDENTNTLPDDHDGETCHPTIPHNHIIRSTSGRIIRETNCPSAAQNPSPPSPHSHPSHSSCSSSNSIRRTVLLASLGSPSSDGGNPFSDNDNDERIHTLNSSYSSSGDSQITVPSTGVMSERTWVRAREAFFEYDASGELGSGGRVVYGEGRVIEGENGGSDRWSMRSSDHGGGTSGSTPSSSVAASHNGKAGHSTWNGGWAWLWKTSAHTDITISCGAYSFPLHKSILSAQCPYFRNLLHQNSHNHPHGNEVLELPPTISPEALRCLLRYLYTGTLEDIPMDSLLILGGPDIPSLDILLKVYKLASQYQLPELKQLATEQYCAVLSHPWPKVHGILLAKGLVETFAEDLEEPEVLREATLEVAVRFAEELLGYRVVYDMLYGEPLRALTLRLSRRACAGEGFNRPRSVPEEEGSSLP